MKSFVLIFFTLIIISSCISQNIIDYYPNTFKTPIVFDKNTIRFLYDSTKNIESEIIEKCFVNKDNDTIFKFNDSIEKFYPLFKRVSNDTFALFSYLRVNESYLNKYRFLFDAVYYTVFINGPKPYVLSNYSLYADCFYYPKVFYWFNDSLFFAYKSSDTIIFNNIKKQYYSIKSNLEIGHIGNNDSNKNENKDYIYGSFVEIDTPYTFNTDFYNKNNLFFQINDSLFKDSLAIWKVINSKKVENYILNPMFCFSVNNTKYYFYVVKWEEYNLYGVLAINEDKTHKIIELCIDKDSCHNISIKNKKIIVKDFKQKVVKTISL